MCLTLVDIYILSITIHIFFATHVSFINVSAFVRLRLLSFLPHDDSCLLLLSVATARRSIVALPAYIGLRTIRYDSILIHK